MEEHIWMKYPPKKENILLILRDAQSVNENYISDKLFKEIAEYVNIPLAELDSIVSFYSNYNREKKGKYLISVCDSLSCSVSGSTNISTIIQNSLNVQYEQVTADGLFYIESVNCLGSCDTAPNVMINGVLYKNMDKEKTVSLLNILKEESENV